MKIKLLTVSIAQLTEGYRNHLTEGVSGYGGKLDIRPPYQREFIYNAEQQKAVIDTVAKGFPLNVMYWAAVGDDKFEMIDGQQRTLSICDFVDGGFSCGGLFGQETPLMFDNLQDNQRQKILDYKLTVYACRGSGSDKLAWFKTINIAGEKLTEQELRNAVFAGTWVSDARKYFSKPGCAAKEIGGDYLQGSAIRQDYLQTAIKWKSAFDNNGRADIDGYMGARQNEPNANELWLYFKRVMDWTQTVFPNYRAEMKGLAWGEFYNAYGDDKHDAKALEKRVAQLMQDDDVTRRQGIYDYVLSGNESKLNIRAFSASEKRAAYERQQGICAKCKKKFELNEMDADHIKPWAKGGKTIPDNCQVLCVPCNRGG